MLMKKIFRNFLALVLIFALTLSLAACGEEAADPEPETKDLVTMEFVMGSDADNTSTFLISNNSEEDINYGTSYFLEYLDGDEWAAYEPDEPLMWTMILITLECFEETQFNVNWEFGYGRLPDGTYRLGKEFWVEGEEPFNVYAEFEVPFGNNPGNDELEKYRNVIGDYQITGTDDNYWHLFIGQSEGEMRLSIYDNAAGNPGVGGTIDYFDDSVIRIRIDEDLFDALPSSEWETDGEYLEMTYESFDTGIILTNNGDPLMFMIDAE